MNGASTLLAAIGAAILTFILSLVEGFISPVVEGVFGSPEEDDEETVV